MTLLKTSTYKTDKCCTYLEKYSPCTAFYRTHLTYILYDIAFAKNRSLYDETNPVSLHTYIVFTIAVYDPCMYMPR